MIETSFAPVRADGASRYLRERWGVAIKPSTLGKLRCTGGGPKFRRAGRWPIYETADLDEWAKARRSRKVASTSDLPPLYKKREREAAA
jgi:hypothetical protein